MQIHGWILTGTLILATAAPAFADGPIYQGCARQRSKTTRPLSGANFAQIALDPAFPNSVQYGDTTIDNLRNTIKAALVNAALKWNRGCGPAPLLNKHPVFYVADAPTSGGATQKNILVQFNPGRHPKGVPCGPGFLNLCYPPFVWTEYDNGALVLQVYGYYGDDISPNFFPTLVDFANFLDLVLAHELGHGLDLEHDNCPGSVMDLPPALTDGSPKYINSDQCQIIETIHEPADPLDGLNIDPCKLLFYCDPYTGGFLTPWPQIRSRCSWFPDVIEVTSSVSIMLPNGGGLLEILNVTLVNVMVYECFGGGFNFDSSLAALPEPEHLQGPALSLGLPRPSEQVSGMMNVYGWAWGRSHPLLEVKVFVDGAPVQLQGFQQHLWAPQLCDAGVDPQYCSRNSGFYGRIDTSGMSPGRHEMVIVATDTYDDPLPVQQKVVFYVASPLPNHPPVAVPDEASVSIVGGNPRTVDIPVMANDWDPEQNNLYLPGDCLLVPPSSGVATCLPNGQVRYTPIAGASGNDFFTYRIRDAFEAESSAGVSVRIYEAFPLP